jgi:hypothetical protein
MLTKFAAALVRPMSFHAFGVHDIVTILSSALDDARTDLPVF